MLVHAGLVVSPASRNFCAASFHAVPSLLSFSGSPFGHVWPSSHRLTRPHPNGASVSPPYAPLKVGAVAVGSCAGGSSGASGGFLFDFSVSEWLTAENPSR